MMQGFCRGGEGACEDFYNNSGALFDMAPKLGALIVFLEHRYYGRSLPFGNQSYGTHQMRFLTVEQALAGAYSHASTGLTHCSQVLTLQLPRRHDRHACAQDLVVWLRPIVGLPLCALRRLM